MSVPFELTKSLLDDILEAMDNRNERFVVAVGEGGTASVARWLSDAEGVLSKPLVAEGEPPSECYPLPEWTSDAGYALRCDFVRRLHAPIAADVLDEALHSGRGAFRAFKDAIRSYPQVERLWHRYKRQQMADCVWTWYDALCDEWGLEHLARTLDDEDGKTSDLLREDFDFAPFGASDRADVERAITVALQETSLPREAAAALVSRYHRQMASGAQGVAVRTVDGDFAGCITWEADSGNDLAPAGTSQDRGAGCGVIFLTSIVVVKEWRGLGIASTLLEECTNDCGEGYVVCALPVTCDALDALMQKAMFQRAGTLWWKSTTD